MDVRFTSNLGGRDFRLQALGRRGRVDHQRSHARTRATGAEPIPHHLAAPNSPATAEIPSAPLRVLVGGGGIETRLGPRDLAGERAERTRLTPQDEFVYRPMAVAEPFARGHAQHHRIDAIADDLGARLIHGSLAAVEDGTRTAVTGSGERLSYDALVIAIGAASEPAFARALTWTPDTDAEIYGGLLRDVEEGYTKQVAFVNPPGVARAAAADVQHVTEPSLR